MSDYPRRPKPPPLGHCVRLESCLGEASAGVLADALAADDQHLFAEILNAENSAEFVNDVTADGASTVLHLALAADGSTCKSDFAAMLLRHPAVDPNKPNLVERSSPIHLAAEVGDHRILKLLLDAGADPNAKMEDGSTALHRLAVRSAALWAPVEDRSILQDRFVQATELLLSTPAVLFDVTNNIGVTPLYFALHRGTKEVAAALLARGARVDVEVDEEDETLEDMLKDKMPDLYQRLDLRKNRGGKAGGDTLENKLFHVLYEEAEKPGGFMTAWEKEEKNNNQKVDPDADDGGYTFLQYACDQGLENVVAFLLEKGADPNQTTNGVPPIVSVGHHGYHRIMKLFKEHQAKNPGSVNFAACDTAKQENVLHRVLKAESKNHANLSGRDYALCLALLLAGDPASRKLIWPCVDAQDNLGNTPLHVAAYLGRDETIRQLLRCGANIGIKNAKGEAAITTISPEIVEEYLDECLQGEGLLVDPKFRLTFLYTFLGPSLCQNRKSLDKGDEQEKTPLRDSESATPDNASIQALPEAEPLWHLSQSLEHRHLLLHPIIRSFLSLKWGRMRFCFYVNLAVYVCFMALLTVYLILNNTIEDRSNDALSRGFRYATAVFLVVMTIREVFQAMVSFRRYMFSIENILEDCMLVTVYVLVFGDVKNPLVVRNLSGAALLLSWVELLLLLGRHPKLSTYVAMLGTVSRNFAQFLFWYAPILLAFALSFFLVLRSPDEDTNEYFSTPDRSLLKTIVMSLTGEIEFESIDFSGGLFPVLLFLAYVFFVMLVLVNLLNGLAITDITEIRKHADIVSQVSRIEYISYTESMLLGDPFSFLSNWPQVACLDRLPSCSCAHVLRALTLTRPILDWFAKRMLLFRCKLKDKMAVFMPNTSVYEETLPKPNNLRLERDVLRDAVDLAKRQRLKQQGRGVEKLEEFEKLEKKLDALKKIQLFQAEQLNKIIEMLNEKE